MLAIGSQAPDPAVTTHQGYTGPLSDFWKDGPLVLFFYPKDHTRVCTKQACTLQDNLAAFGKTGANVLGASTGSLASHQSFASENGLAFPLIVDPHGAVAKVFQAFRPLLRICKRITYVINRSGTIIGSHHNEFSVPPHLEMIGEVLAAQDAAGS